MIASCTALGRSSSCDGALPGPLLRLGRRDQRAGPLGLPLPGGGGVALRLGVDLGLGRPRPCATSACSSRQRRSVSTVSPAGTVDVQQPAAGSSSSTDCGSTLPASELTTASWASEPGGAVSSRKRSASTSSGQPRSAAHCRVGVGRDGRLGLQQQPLHARRSRSRRRGRPRRARRSRGPSARPRGSSPTPPTSTGCAAAARRCRRSGRSAWRASPGRAAARSR